MVSVKNIIFPGLLPSFLKVRYYRYLKGAKIGKGTKIGLFSYINSPKIVMGKQCKIGLFTFIDITKEFVLGNSVFIGLQTSIRTGIVNIGDDTQIYDNVRIGGILTHRSKLLIGKKVGIFPYSYINPTYEIILEDGVGIGGRCHLFTHGAWPSYLDGYPMKYAPITIKKDVWLAWRISVLPGVTIGENSVIQSDALVSKDVPPKSLVKGNPATIKPLRVPEFDDEKKISILKMICEDFYKYLEFKGEEVVYFPDSKTFFGLNLYQKKKLKLSLAFWIEDIKLEYTEIIKSQKIREDKLINILFKKTFLSEMISNESKNSSTVFVIESREFFGNNDWLDEVREFFKRYGIYFDRKLPLKSKKKF